MCGRPEKEDGRGSENLLGLGAVIGGGAAEHLYLFGNFRVINGDQIHEAIKLRLGKIVGAFLFDGILRGEDKKERFEAIALVADRNLLFLHGLQKSRLRLGRRAVDLVGENDVGEDRAGHEHELAAAACRVLLDNLCTGDVRGHEIRRELHPLERNSHDLRDGGHQKSLGQTRDAHKEGVVMAEDALQSEIYQFLLPTITLPISPLIRPMVSPNSRATLDSIAADIVNLLGAG